MNLNAEKILSAIVLESYISITRAKPRSAAALLRRGEIATFWCRRGGGVFYAAPGFARDGFTKVVPALEIARTK